MSWKTITLFVVILGIVYKLCQKQPLSPKTDFNVEDWTYTHDNFASPILYGSRIKIARLLLQIPILSDIICNFLWNTNGYYELTNFGNGLNIIPSYLPIRSATDQEVEGHKKSANKHDYKNALKSIESIQQILGKPVPSKNMNKERFLSIEAIHNAYKSNKITPYEFAKQSLFAADKLSKLNAFIALNTTDILQQAQESTIRWKSGNILSILDGIPIAIKDDTDVCGYNTSHGTSFKSKLHGIAVKDALIVSRLRELGVIIFGKTNLHEIGIDCSGINSHWNTTFNPYSKHLLHDTGGSSSGSAAVVSSGIVPIAVGTDGGGSIRIPASFQGLIGIKATWNRITDYMGGWWSVSHIGFLTNNIRDAAICYLAVSGYKHNDNDNYNKQKKYDIINNRNVISANPPIHLDSFKKINDLNGLKIGIYWDWFNDAQSDIVKMCTKMVENLEKNYNAKIINIKIPYLDILTKAHLTIILTEVTETESIYMNMNMPYHDSTLFTLIFGKKTVGSLEIMAALKVRSWFMEYFENEIFDKIDVILLPMTSIVTPKYVLQSLDTSISNAENTIKICKYAGFSNFLGLPAFTIPIGYTDIDGDDDKTNDTSLFPIGLQLIADHWNENILFRIGNIIQQNVDIKLPPNYFKHSL